MSKRITWDADGSRGTGASTTAALNGMSNLYASMQGNNRIADALSAMGKRRSDNENQNAVAAIMGASPENRAGVRNNIIAGLSKGANPVSVMADSNQLLQQRFQTENQGRKLDAELRSSNAYARNVDNTISKQDKKLSDGQKMNEIMLRSVDPETGEPILKTVMKMAQEFGINPENVGPGIQRFNANSGLTAKRTAAEQLRKEGVAEKLRRISPSGNKGSSVDIKPRVNYRNPVIGGGTGKVAMDAWGINQVKKHGFHPSVISAAKKAGLVQTLTGGAEYDMETVKVKALEFQDEYNKSHPK